MNKKIFYSTILLVLLFSIRLDGNNSLRFNKKVHDFGNIDQHQKVETTFYYTNVSDQVITIKKVHSSCGCTVPEISKKILEPGESGEVKVVFNSGRYKGSVGKTIFFELEPKIDSPRIMIKAIVYPDIYLDQENIFISNIAKEKPIEKEVKVLSGKFTNFRISNINYNTQYIKILTDTYKEKNQSGYILHITIYPDKIATTYFKEEVNIETDISSTKKLTLLIHGYVK